MEGLERAQAPQGGRRALGLVQQDGIVGVAHQDQPGAFGCAIGQFALDAFAGRRRRGAPIASGEVGQGVQRADGAAEALHQTDEIHRPDARRPRQS